jgi:hypothetical protein
MGVSCAIVGSIIHFWFAYNIVVSFYIVGWRVGEILHHVKVENESFQRSLWSLLKLEFVKIRVC